MKFITMQWCHGVDTKTHDKCTQPDSQYSSNASVYTLFQRFCYTVPIFRYCCFDFLMLIWGGY